MRLRKFVAWFDTQISASSMKRRLIIMDQKINDLMAAVERLRAAVTASTQAKSDLHAHVADLQAQLDALAAEKAELQAEMDKLTAVTADIDAQTQALAN